MSYQLFYYALEVVSSMRAIIRKFSLGLYCDVVKECEATILKNDMDISSLLVTYNKL